MNSLVSINKKLMLVTNEERYDRASKFAKKIFWLASIPFDPIIGLFTQSLSDMLGLETLTHGTSLWNYLSIRVEGADPKFGGKEGGSSYSVETVISKGGGFNWQKESEGFFFLFKDSGMILIGDKFEQTSVVDNKRIKEFRVDISKFSIPRYLISSRLTIPFATRMHAIVSGYGSPLPYKKPSFHIVTRIGGAVASLFTPTINFRFIPEDEDLDLNRYNDQLQNGTLQIVSKSDFEGYFKNYEGKFQEDTSYGGVAWKTKEKIGTEHIGLYGIMRQGVKGNLKDRIKKNPAKFLYGTIRLVSLIALTAGILSSLGFVQL